jgi:acetylornithine deacetylase/succinyl-diaminopimelate desuccinylase-like protein
MEIFLDQIQQDVIHTLQDLIRFNTTNPPGNELPCVTYIQQRLAAENIESTILESAPGRGSIVARLRGDGSARPLLLLGHIDVVPTEPSQWSHPPFSAEIVDGYLWGRGAIDMKGLAALELELFLLLKRLGVPLKRDVILAATADEEAGGTFGMAWLAENHFDQIDAEYCINEGGGVGTQQGERWFFGCQTAEKGICWLRLSAHGRPGHASVPWGSTAVTRLAAAVEKLAHARTTQHLIPTVEHYIKALAEITPAPAGPALLGLLDPQREIQALSQIENQGLAAQLHASLHNTFTPTLLKAGEKINVIPSVAEAQVDCRLIPGQTPAQAVAELAQIIGDEIEIEVVRTSPGIESSSESALFTLMQQVLEEVLPGSVLTPFLVPGGTDGRFLAAKGVKVYGFWPMLEKPGEASVFQLAHAHNERISLENLEFGAQVLWEVIRRFAAE